MSVGDELFFTEALYHEMMGRFVSAIELLNKRVALKDQRITELEAELLSLRQSPTKEPKK